jgi:hypothetical protein
MSKLIVKAGCWAVLIFALFATGCGKKAKVEISDADILHNNEDQLTQVIIYDVFTPPVASRIYSYSSLASYEAMKYSNPKYKSITKNLKGFKEMPQPEKGKSYNYTLAATKAFFTVVRKVVFSVDSLDAYENTTYSNFQEAMDDSTYARSIEFGEKIGKAVLERSATDNYKNTRGKPKFLGSNTPGEWRPTAPDYLDGVEYCWGTMRTFALDTSSQFPCPKPVKYSIDSTSAFYKQTLEVYNINKNLSAEQKTIAKYWDDNPFVLEHAGHLTFANKKITPGGHWIGITAIACKKSKADAVKTAQAYAATSVAMYDAFISCWQDKYETKVVRPITVIQELIDKQWLPMLQTPPFPEYPSGHSAITRAAATVLTHLFGDNFEFNDTSDLKYIGMQREFKSFIQASNEASISRVYGGIHYMSGVKAGADQGQKVGDYVLNKLEFR